VPGWRWLRPAFAVAAALWIALGAARAEDGVLDRRETMSWEGRERSFLMHLPGASATGVFPVDGLPLVIVLHGAGSDGAAFAAETQFATAAEAAHVLAVFPDGIGTEPGRLTWNAHFCCGVALAQKSDDVGFIVALVDRIAAELPVDRQRIYLAGMSNGGMFAYQLAAARPDLFAAVAAVSATIGGTSRDGEPFVIAPPDRPMSVMIIHGRRDPYVLFDGGTSKLLGYPKRSNMSVADALAFWTKVDGCGEPPERAEIEPGRLARVDYPECRGGSEVVLWEIVDGEHNWPPADLTFPAPDGSRRSAAPEILAFFVAHRRE
jgi:polyhydroxybutyrate depolymerase